jgi:RNA polymerase sigma-70 factor
MGNDRKRNNVCFLERPMKRRDKNLFTALVHEHMDMLLTYIRATIHDSATVDDIFQETMLVAWRRFDDYDPKRPLAKWLRGIARKLILAHFSRLKRRPVYLNESALQILDERLTRIESQPGDTWKDKVAALDTCLKHLPPALRQCTELFYRDQYKTEEIAQTVHASREAVKKRLQRARALLADCLRRKGLFHGTSTEPVP